MSASEGRVLASDRELKDSDESSSSGAKSKSQYQQQRQRRNPAVLIRWIEEHPYNPYPTKSEKHYLSFYSGMTQRQLNDWFANARRNIKKVGYESWKKKHSGFSAILSGIPLQGRPNLRWLVNFSNVCFCLRRPTLSGAGSLSAAAIHVTRLQTSR